MLIDQNNRIPDFYAKRHAERLVFSRDFEAWMTSQNLKQLQNTALDQAKGKLAAFWRRELKLRFNMWRDNV